MRYRSLLKVTFILFVMDIIIANTTSVNYSFHPSQDLVYYLHLLNAIELGYAANINYIMLYIFQLLILYSVFNRSKSNYIVKIPTYSNFYKKVVLEDIIIISLIVSSMAFICNLFIHIYKLNIELVISNNIIIILFINAFINVLYFIFILQLYEILRIKFGKNIFWVFSIIFLVFMGQRLNIINDFSLTNIINELLFKPNYVSSIYYVILIGFFNVLFYEINLKFGYKKEFYE